ncbi:MAG: PorT family protein [Candidatus Eisenbacteria bacterium]|uniref:PorT family protein n=1 Tax=Eiseniibacteriota bacterium TaxID=2212470 RepID=A0A933SG97_UNCEI|nr:PorT family protein [Candidatus Eisenbacteria bacterium]
MRGVLHSIVALACLASFTGTAGASGLSLRSGIELGAGMSRYDWETTVPNIDTRWGPALGAGLFVEGELPSGFRLGTGLGYRYTGEEARSTASLGGQRYEIRSKLRMHGLALPLRLDHAIPRIPALALELGVQAEYVLKAEEKYEDNTYPALRSTRPSAVIFEDLTKWYEVTYASHRLGAAATAGLTWRTKLFSRDAALAARYEHGLTSLWNDPPQDYDRHARRLSAALRVAW